MCIHSLYATNTDDKTSSAFIVDVVVNDVEISMHIDTAADLSVMSKDVYNQHFSHCKLEMSDEKLSTYTNSTRRKNSRPRTGVCPELAPSKVKCFKFSNSQIQIFLLFCYC